MAGRGYGDPSLCHPAHIPSRRARAGGAASGIIKINCDIRMVDALQYQKVGSMLSVLCAT
jgi:hypothetical protein